MNYKNLIEEQEKHYDDKKYHEQFNETFAKVSKQPAVYIVTSDEIKKGNTNEFLFKKSKTIE